jgi:hypothetical protein
MEVDDESHYPDASIADRGDDGLQRKEERSLIYQEAHDDPSLVTNNGPAALSMATPTPSLASHVASPRHRPTSPFSVHGSPSFFPKFSTLSLLTPLTLISDASSRSQPLSPRSPGMSDLDRPLGNVIDTAIEMSSSLYDTVTHSLNSLVDDGDGNRRRLFGQKTDQFDQNLEEKGEKDTPKSDVNEISEAEEYVEERDGCKDMVDQESSLFVEETPDNNRSTSPHSPSNTPAFLTFSPSLSFRRPFASHLPSLSLPFSEEVKDVLHEMFDDFSQRSRYFIGGVEEDRN